jgi:hypothetical protein
MRFGRWISLTALTLAGALSMTGCGGEADAGAADDVRLVSEAAATVNLTDAPQAPLLHIEGVPGGPVDVDLADLGSLRTVEADVHNPWEDAVLNYRGVLFSDLLTALDVPETATTATFTALDEYVVVLPIAELRSGRVLLATHANGAIEAVDHGGPIRVVFLPGSEQGRNKDQWIWSLRDLAIT